MFSIRHNFDDETFTNSRAEWIPDESFPKGSGVAKGARRTWCCCTLDIEKIISIRPPDKKLRITGTCVNTEDEKLSFRDVSIEVIPDEGRTDKWQYGKFFVEVDDARIVAEGCSEEYSLDQARQEVRQAGYDYAGGCEDCADSDTTPVDVLSNWILDLASECLTEGEPDLCEKYWAAIDFNDLCELFTEGLQRYFDEHFANNEKGQWKKFGNSENLSQMNHGARGDNHGSTDPQLERP